MKWSVGSVMKWSVGSVMKWSVPQGGTEPPTYR